MTSAEGETNTDGAPSNVDGGAPNGAAESSRPESPLAKLKLETESRPETPTRKSSKKIKTTRA